MTSVEWFREHSCTKKSCYATRDVAKIARRRLTRKYGIRPDIYRCGFCDGYHLGKPWNHDLKEQAS